VRCGDKRCYTFSVQAELAKIKNSLALPLVDTHSTKMSDPGSYLDEEERGRRAVR